MPRWCCKSIRAVKVVVSGCVCCLQWTGVLQSNSPHLNKYPFASYTKALKTPAATHKEVLGRCHQPVSMALLLCEVSD
jgi:hypothetical protein